MLAFATVGRDGSPQVRNISAIHYEPDALYFFTARGKDFCQELLADGRVQILGYTKYKEMIRLSARAVPLPEEEQAPWIHRIFAEQPYLANVYPGTPGRSAWSLPSGPGRSSTSTWGSAPSSGPPTPLGGSPIHPKGYEITEDCLACGLCLDPCPQGCIQPGEPYVIQQEHCLHCGSCLEHCPASAVRPRTAATQD